MCGSNGLWKIDESMILSVLQQWVDLCIFVLRGMYEKSDLWKIDENMILSVLQGMCESNDLVVDWSMISVIADIDLWMWLVYVMSNEFTSMLQDVGVYVRKWFVYVMRIEFGSEL